MTRRQALVPALVAAAAQVVTACSSSGSSAARSTTGATTGATGAAGSTSGLTTAGAPSHGSGPVDVLYAGSLQTLMEDAVGPAFHASTGYTLSGTGGDSGSLANEVKGGTIRGDVYISANPSKDRLLEGSSNGNWLSWYATFGTSPLLIAYNPHSRFAADFETKPWYDVLAEAGIRVGRTDPATDPKGVLAAQALQAAATTYHLPQLRVLSSGSSDIYAETTLIAQLQSGQVDAGFFYGVEASAAHLTHTVAVSGVGTLDASYTVATLNRAPHVAGADAFVRYLLGPAGRAILADHGITVTRPPTVSGPAPAALGGVLSGR